MAADSCPAERIRPLPETDLISLSQAVTWLATGRAREARTLKRFRAIEGYIGLPKHLYIALEEASGRIVSLIRNKKLTAFGSRGDGPRELIPRDYFANEVYGDYMRDTFEAELLTWERGDYPEGLPEYRSVRFWRSELLETLTPLVEDIIRAKPSLATRTVAAETRCFEWLVGLMRDGPQREPKTVYSKRAIAEFNVGARQFDRAWSRAKVETGTKEWGRSGRRAVRD